MKIKNATGEQVKIGWHYYYEDLQQLKSEVEKVNADGCSMEQLQDILDLINYKEQQSQLRTLAEAVLMIDNNWDWETLTVGKTEAQSMINACQLARESMEVENER